MISKLPRQGEKLEECLALHLNQVTGNWKRCYEHRSDSASVYLTLNSMSATCTSNRFLTYAKISSTSMQTTMVCPNSLQKSLSIFLFCCSFHSRNQYFSWENNWAILQKTSFKTPKKSATVLTSCLEFAFNDNAYNLNGPCWAMKETKHYIQLQGQIKTASELW